MFGGSKNTFGQQSATPAFSSFNPQPQQNAGFGQSAFSKPAGAFGASFGQQNSSVFGAQPAPGTSLFGSTNPAQQQQQTAFGCEYFFVLFSFVMKFSRIYFNFVIFEILQLLANRNNNNSSKLQSSARPTQLDQLLSSVRNKHQRLALQSQPGLGSVSLSSRQLPCSRQILLSPSKLLCLVRQEQRTQPVEDFSEAQAQLDLVSRPQINNQEQPSLNFSRLKKLTLC